MRRLRRYGGRRREPRRPGRRNGARRTCPENTPEFLFGPTEGLLADSERGGLQARLIEADPAPPQKYENNWTIELGALDGTPLEDVDLGVDDVLAWMPVHNHYEPPHDVVAQSEPGQFRLVYLNLRMRGPWEVRVEVDSPSAGTDLLTFRVCVEDD